MDSEKVIDLSRYKKKRALKTNEWGEIDVEKTQEEIIKKPSWPERFLVSMVMFFLITVLLITWLKL